MSTNCLPNELSWMQAARAAAKRAIRDLSRVVKDNPASNKRLTNSTDGRESIALSEPSSV